MIIYPAVDIAGGKCVRLYKGKIEQAKIYFDNPVDAAKMWADSGAEWIHVVDLDGALRGKLSNISVIRSILRSVNAKIQFGGGIRDYETAKELINIGVSRIVVGTKAIDDRQMIARLCQAYGDKVAIGLDLKGSKISSSGWTRDSDIVITDFICEMERLGVKLFIYTQIQRDGTLQGPDVEGLKHICEITKGDVIASGGISSLDDVKNILKMRGEGVCGMIIGKALYEKTFSLESAIKLAKH